MDASATLGVKNDRSDDWVFLQNVERIFAHVLPYVLYRALLSNGFEMKDGND